MLSRTFHDLPFPRRNLHVMEGERMAEQNAESGDGVRQQPSKQARVREYAGGFLPEPQHFGPEVVLYLGAVEGAPDHQPGDHIPAMEQLVLLLDVQEFNGERFRRGRDLRFR